MQTLLVNLDQRLEMVGRSAVRTLRRAAHEGHHGCRDLPGQRFATERRFPPIAYSRAEAHVDSSLGTEGPSSSCVDVTDDEGTDVNVDSKEVRQKAVFTLSIYSPDSVIPALWR